jgi:polyisoprenoid-binding protein YceI
LNGKVKGLVGRAALLSALVLFLFSPAAKAAQSVQVVLDTAHTTIDWTLTTTLHNVHGTFKLKSGQIAFDPATGTAGGELVVDAASGESGNHSRDDKMNKDVLETKRYPEITFLPKKVVGRVPTQGSATVQVQGTFHIHGTDHDLTLSIPLTIAGTEAKASTSFDIPYEAWGMKNPGNFLLHVDNKVQIKIEAVGRMTMAGAAHDAH